MFLWFPHSLLFAQKDLTREINFTPTSNVGVTLAWRVLHSAPSLQINNEPTNNTAQLKTDG